jgi:hypothetical protein
MKRKNNPTNTPTTPEPILAPADLMTPDEAAEILGITPATLQMRRHQHRPPRYYKLGPGISSHVRYSQRDVLDYLSGCLIDTSASEDGERGADK